MIVLLTVAISEFVLSARWSKFYFLHGIKIFSGQFDISDPEKVAVAVRSFINHMEYKNGFSKYTGMELEENTFAFRRKMIDISFFRNDFERIHGSITIDSENRTLNINGYAGYTFLAFILYICLFLVSGTDSIIFGILSNLFLICIVVLIAYALCRRKYKKLTAIIDEILNDQEKI